MTRAIGVATAVVSVWLGAFVPLAHAADTSGRTPYERLDLSTPDAAARVFIRAWARRDFVIVYAVLSMKAQEAAESGLFRLDLMLESVPNPNQQDQKGLDYMFDGLLMAIDRHNALPLDLEESTPIDPARFLSDGSAEVIAHPSRMPVPVVLRVVRSASGRWRVERAMEQDGKASELPFGR
jgi:hypothetical protein